MIKSAGALALVSSILYNRRAGTLPGYISQLVFLPSKFATCERHHILRLLHMPVNALSLDACIDVTVVGGPTFVSCSPSNLAAMFSTATRTCSGWQALLRWLHSKAEDCLPTFSIILGDMTPFFWDSPPLVVNLQEAALSFPAFPRVYCTLSEQV